jgi:hypothetical protein
MRVTILYHIASSEDSDPDITRVGVEAPIEARARTDEADAQRAQTLCSLARTHLPANADLDEVGDYDERTGTLDVFCRRPAEEDA